MRKRILSLLLAAVLLLSSVLMVSSSEISFPSLFWNDEIWYRDSITPLVIYKGKYCIPTDLCSMFDYIDVSVHANDNVLIENKNTGGYISALAQKQKAVCNGEITDAVCFRENGIFYIDAELVADILSLDIQYLVYEGQTVLRIFDSNARKTFGEILRAIDIYDSVEEEHNDRLTELAKSIYIYCSYDTGEINSIVDALDEAGLEYTLFLSERDGKEAIIKASSCGEYGLVPSVINHELVSAMNTAFSAISMRKVHTVLNIAGCDNITAKELSDCGYIVIEPDFYCDASTNAYEMVAAIEDILRQNEKCSIYISKSYNGVETVKLISMLDTVLYRTYNIDSGK